MSTSPSLAIVACCYRMPPAEMMRRVQALLPADAGAVTGFAVSAHQAAAEDLGQDWTALPSDNLDFDFSAYIAGAQAVVDRGLADRPVLFLNDTLFSDHAAAANFRALWRLLPLLSQIELPALAGKADPYSTVCLRNPWSRLSLYVSSFCFLLNPAALPVMLRLRALADEDGVTHAHDVNTPEWGSSLPSAFRQFLKSALVYLGSPYLWYRLQSGSYSPAQLRSKARCIYFEHRLSGAIGQTGCLLPSNAGPRWRSYLTFHEFQHRLFRKARR
jgi:hypothetical protein